MKTLMTAAMLAALTLTAAAFGQNPGKPDPTPAAKVEPTKTAGKKVTIEELGEMLYAMGYETTAFNDKNGKLVGYDVTFPSDGYALYGTFLITSDGRLWVFGSFALVADESTPPAVLLAMLGVNDQVQPAYLHYSAKTKKFMVMLPFANGNITPAVLRANTGVYLKAVKTALDTWTTAKGKADAIAKEKAEAQSQK